ncbi:MAG: hypothetical protein M3253_08180 [Chloroflexota bacterium]|nr:hypothetical protein [Chloroflexota bacterium]
MTPPRAPVQRSWLDVRWRQLRNPPPPVVRAVLANLGIASVGGLLLFAYDLFADGGDLPLLIAIFVLVVIAGGSALTYLWVELPTGASGVRRRSGWAALLGLFASLPIAYLVLVIVFHVIRPLLA